MLLGRLGGALLLSLVFVSIGDAADPAPAPSVQPLANAFKRADTNGDGKLSEDEAKKAGFFTDEKFMEADRDGDSGVTLFELGKAVGGRMQEWSAKHHQADTDKDGYVTKDEASKADSSWNAMFDKADTNHDGKVAQEELMGQVTHGYYSETATQPLVPNIIDQHF